METLPEKLRDRARKRRPVSNSSTRSEHQLLLDFGQGQGTILKCTIDHTSDDAPARYRGFSGKFKATDAWFFPNEAVIIEKKAIASGVNFIRIDRVEANESTDVIDSGAQVDHNGALDRGVNQKGFHKIQVSFKV